MLSYAMMRADADTERRAAGASVGYMSFSPPMPLLFRCCRFFRHVSLMIRLRYDDTHYAITLFISLPPVCRFHYASLFSLLMPFSLPMAAMPMMMPFRRHFAICSRYA